MDSKKAPNAAAMQAPASPPDNGRASGSPADAKAPDSAPSTRSSLMNFLVKLLTLGRKF